MANGISWIKADNYHAGAYRDGQRLPFNIAAFRMGDDGVIYELWETGRTGECIARSKDINELKQNQTVTNYSSEVFAE